jgi:hypothetical protein
MSWNYNSIDNSSSGYEDVKDELLSYTKEKYINTTEQEKQKMIDNVFDIYRSKNIFPITYYNENGIIYDFACGFGGRMLGALTSKNNIGFSAITDKEELISGEVKLLQGISDRLTEKAQYRRIRRSRLRYRKARFDNRKVDKGWLAPSIQHKLDRHIRFIDKLKSILPISYGL